MAQHDYIIANQSGAAFRADLNNALAAIVSQNSGAAEPSVTYAYMPWADTTTGLFKIRNAANSAWITLYQLDGEWSTIALEDGTAAAPSLYFKDSGTDTGFYSPGVDQAAIATAGVQRVNFSTTEVVFNDGGADVDFRIEGDTKANLFKVDAGTDAVSIDGTAQLANQTPLRFGDSDNSHYVALRSPGTVAADVTWDLPSADGTADQSLVTDGSGSLSFAARSRLVLGTAVASTSGTSIDFTGIPTWVKRVTVMFNEVSTNGTSMVLTQLGAGTIQTTGYRASASVNATGVATVNSTTGFTQYNSGNDTASSIRNGLITFALVGSNVWAASGVIGLSDVACITMIGGSVTLSGTLDRVRITTVNGTDTFDAGTINILWEG